MYYDSLLFNKILPRYKHHVVVEVHFTLYMSHAKAFKKVMWISLNWSCKSHANGCKDETRRAFMDVDQQRH